MKAQDRVIITICEVFKKYDCINDIIEIKDNSQPKVMNQNDYTEKWSNR